MTAHAPLDPADVVTAAGFLVVVIGAMAVGAVKSSAKESPRARMLQRAMNAAAAERTPGTAVDTDAAVRLRSRLSDNQLAINFAKFKANLLHITGITGLYWMAAAAVACPIAIGFAVKFLGLSAWLNLPVAPVGALMGACFAYLALKALYRRRFLASFPDALDLIIRAVRAGVPVIQAIRTAGKELPDPVGREFRIMGDALRLGLDQDEVMESATKRIGLADFQFFAVCLQLQRETGGPLAETLENLAAIIRARREVQLKTRALTAQGRASTKIIAMVPVGTLFMLNFISPEYVNILFDTPSGHTVLWIATGMVLTGLVVINRMAKLED